MNIEQFTRAYIVAALWSSIDDEGEPFDAVYTVDDIAPGTLQRMREDCADFVAGNAAALADYCDTMARRGGNPDEMAGHDFWLTRNGHGAGFWDRGAGPAGSELTRAAKVYRSIDLYVGDDGFIYGG